MVNSYNSKQSKCLSVTDYMNGRIYNGCTVVVTANYGADLKVEGKKKDNKKRK